MATTIKTPEYLQHFIESTDVRRLSKNLRNLLIEHLAIQEDGHSFNLEDLLGDILNLFELLDVLEKEGK